ncbi:MULTISPECIES: DUF6415 family natural product biosynthesis protein [unclassified Streptomyces]|uniref:DUF6415 family natural product biosynthesis protein n=1 Tax=unclassified Streptomyces TaxID=2593676 RepID=UPI00386479D7|nr:DUF6415 family natural product biosynthesis protein [Streptomyces sp. NBC_00827]
MISDAVEMVSASGMRLAPAGVEWDVIKVGRYLAVRTIERIAEPGAIAVNPALAEPALYFFVPAGSAASWDVPQTTPLGLDAHVVLPPDHKAAPPGPYWLISPERGLTQATTLRRALAQTMGSALAQPDVQPPSISSMRLAAAELLGEDAPLPRYEEVQTLTHRYRGNLMLLIPAVEDLSHRLPDDDALARVALVGIGEARRRMDEIEGVGLVSEVKRAQRLGRSVLALCDHYETLSGQTMCVACDRPVEDDQTSVPYGQISPSGSAASTARVHAGCVNAPRHR